MLIWHLSDLHQWVCIKEFIQFGDTQNFFLDDLAIIEKIINIVTNTKLYNSVVSKHNLQMLWILIEQNYLLITHRNAHFDYTKGVGSRD